MNRMLVLLFVLGVAGGAWHFHSRSRPAEAAPEPPPMAVAASDAAGMPLPRAVAGGSMVDVYGRTSCGYTRRMISELQRAGVPMRFHDIDEPATRGVFLGRFANSGLATARGLALPVVSVAGQDLARPSPDSVIYAARPR